MKKIKTYRLSISRTFPSTHPCAGRETCFREAITAALNGHKDKVFSDDGRQIGCFPKLHTIRDNYSLWKKRIDEVNAGNAVLVLYEWEGKPYRSKTQELLRFNKDSGIGVQRLTFLHDRDGCYNFKFGYADHRDVDYYTLAKNDGLTETDWLDWMIDYDFSQPLAIIHFTKFRY